MRFVLRVIMLVWLVGQVGGLTSALSAHACAGECEDDVDGKDCPPTCPSCACSVRSSPSLLPPVQQVIGPPDAEIAEFAETQLAPPSPEPHEILHVPRAPLA